MKQTACARERIILVVTCYSRKGLLVKFSISLDENEILLKYIVQRLSFLNVINTVGIDRHIQEKYWFANVHPIVLIPTYPFSFIQSLDFKIFPGANLHQVLLGRLYYRQYIIQKVNFCMILEESSSYCFGYQCPKQLSFLSLYCLFLLIFCKIIG